MPGKVPGHGQEQEAGDRMAEPDYGVPVYEGLPDEEEAVTKSGGFRIGKKCTREDNKKLWWRYVRGTHPFPSRTRWLRPGRPMVLCWRRHGRVGGCQLYGGVAQLGEHLPCKQGVKSSNLSVSIPEGFPEVRTVLWPSGAGTLKTVYRKDIQASRGTLGGNLPGDPASIQTN